MSATLRPGDIVLTKRDVFSPRAGAVLPLGIGRPALVLHNEPGSINPSYPDVRVAPMSFDVEHAAEFDLILDPASTGLPRVAVVELWNDSPALARNVTLPVGRLSPEDWVFVKSVYGRRFGRKATDGAQPKVGAPLHGKDDPRRAFQQREYELFRFLVGPVNEMLALQSSKSENAADLVILQSALIRDQSPCTALEDVWYRYHGGSIGHIANVLAQPVDNLIDDWSDFVSWFRPSQYLLQLTCERDFHAIVLAGRTNIRYRCEGIDESLYRLPPGAVRKSRIQPTPTHASRITGV